MWKTLIKQIFDKTCVASSEKMSACFFYSMQFHSHLQFATNISLTLFQLRKSCKNEVVPLGINVMLTCYWLKNNPPLVNILLL